MLLSPHKIYLFSRNFHSFPMQYFPPQISFIVFFSHSNRIIWSSFHSRYISQFLCISICWLFTRKFYGILRLKKKALSKAFFFFLSNYIGFMKILHLEGKGNEAKFRFWIFFMFNSLPFYTLCFRNHDSDDLFLSSCYEQTFPGSGWNRWCRRFDGGQILFGLYIWPNQNDGFRGHLCESRITSFTKPQVWSRFALLWFLLQNNGWVFVFIELLGWNSSSEMQFCWKIQVENCLNLGDN